MWCPATCSNNNVPQHAAHPASLLHVNDAQSRATKRKCSKQRQQQQQQQRQHLMNSHWNLLFLQEWHFQFSRRLTRQATDRHGKKRGKILYKSNNIKAFTACKNQVKNLQKYWNNFARQSQQSYDNFKFSFPGHLLKFFTNLQDDPNIVTIQSTPLRFYHPHSSIYRVFSARLSQIGYNQKLLCEIFSILSCSIGIINWNLAKWLFPRRERRLPGNWRLCLAAAAEATLEYVAWDSLHVALLSSEIDANFEVKYKSIETLMKFIT